MRARNADCTCTHNNVVDIFIRLSVFLFFFCFGFLHHCHCKTTPLHLHPVLHPITLCYLQSAVILLGLPAYAFSLFNILRLSTIPIHDSILAKDISLDCSKTWICFAHWSQHVYFTSWLDNIGEFRCSMTEIASHYNHVLTLSTILCQVNVGYLYHHLWSETRQTGNSMGVTIRLESAPADLVKKMERANEIHWREPRDESILKKFPKLISLTRGDDDNDDDDRDDEEENNGEIINSLLFLLHCSLVQPFWKDFKHYFYLLTREFVHLTLHDVMIDIIYVNYRLLN